LGNGTKITRAQVTGSRERCYQPKQFFILPCRKGADAVAVDW
jgi:hypothetical protein